MATKKSFLFSISKMSQSLSYIDAENVSELATKESSKVTFEYIPSLDGLRAIAVIVVVFFHAALIFPELEAYFQGGFLGVDIFFVLSGFLITSILLKEFDQSQNISLKNFYVRRFLRLTPAYWLHLFVILAFAYYLFPKTDADNLFNNNTFYYAFTYLTNWQRALGEPDSAGLLGHTWSLAIEEQFYFFWSITILFFMRNLSRKKIVAATFALIFFTMAFRAWRYTGDSSFNFLYNSFDSRMDALLVGCWFSQICSWKLVSSKFYKSQAFDLVGLLALFVVVAIFFNVPASYKMAYLYQGGFTVFAFAVGILIVWIANRKTNPINRLLQIRPVVWLGKTSYGIYLWHSAAIAILAQTDFSALLKLLFALLLTLAITAISYYAVELPFLRKKELFKV